MAKDTYGFTLEDRGELLAVCEGRYWLVWEEVKKAATHALWAISSLKKANEVLARENLALQLTEELRVEQAEKLESQLSLANGELKAVKLQLIESRQQAHDQSDELAFLKSQLEAAKFEQGNLRALLIQAEAKLVRREQQVDKARALLIS